MYYSYIYIYSNGLANSEANTDTDKWQYAVYFGDRWRYNQTPIISMRSLFADVKNTDLQCTDPIEIISDDPMPTDDPTDDLMPTEKPTDDPIVIASEASSSDKTNVLLSSVAGITQSVKYPMKFDLDPQVRWAFLNGICQDLLKK